MRKQNLGGRITRPVLMRKRSITFILLLLAVLALAVGAQAGEKRLRAVLREAGFRQIRRATETPTNMILEATL